MEGERKRNPEAILITLLIIIGSFGSFLSFEIQNARATNVSGFISTNTTWDLAGSPYTVVGDLTVANGVTLTIEPSVELKFDGFYSLYVDGSLMAVGLQTNRIIITSNMAVPNPKDWDRIQINSSGHTIIKYCDISYGTYGIYLDSPMNNELTNNDLSYNGQFTSGGAIYLESSSNNVITNNNFTYNWNVIYLDSSSNNNITGNNISSNYEMGVILESSSNNNITNNNIKDIGGGIHLSSSSHNYITGNNLSNDGGCICLSSSSNNTIIGNKLFTNSGGGIDLLSASNDNLIKANNVTNYVEGIYLSYSSNNIIVGNNLTDNVEGIYLNFLANNNTITYNNLMSNELGVYLRASLNINVKNNNFLDDGLYIWGDEVPHYTTHMIPTNNLVNGKPLRYYKNCNGINIDGISVGQLILANCENTTVKNLQINNTYAGIEVAMSRNISMTRNNLFSNYRGIYLRLSTNNTLTSNNITDNSYGLELWSSSNNNMITSNIMSANGRAVWLYSSSNNNIITGNNILNNSYGICIFSSSINNKIHHNSIVNSILGQALDDTNSNIWNEAYPSGGNHWSDWISPDIMSGPNQDILGSDGIVDTPYVIDSDSQDKYPLVDPFWSPDTIPPMITNLLPPNASKTNNNTPMISADYGDLSGIDINSVLMKVDGTDVTSSAAITTVDVSYIPETEFGDGLHVVYLEVRDASVNGNLATAIWNFTVNTESPIADAGEDEDIEIGDTISFNGSASVDDIDDLNQLVFTWEISKDGILIITLYGILPSYVFYEEGQFEVNLTVRDTAGNEGYDTLIVTVTSPSKPKDFFSEYWWVLVIIITVVVMLMLFFLFKRKKKPVEPTKIQERPIESKEEIEEK